MAKAATARKILATRTSQLPVHLTEPEIREAGKRLAQHEGELGIHAQKEKEVKDDLKGKRSTIEGQIQQLASVIRQGYEYRPVPVRVEADFKEGKVFEIREDTGEVVAERPVNETDRQAPLFAAQPKPEKEKCGACGVAADQPSAGCEECDHGRKAELEKKADDILANAGDGKLNDKALKGEATARKKGGRRA